MTWPSASTDSITASRKSSCNIFDDLVHHEPGHKDMPAVRSLKSSRTASASATTSAFLEFWAKPVSSYFSKREAEVVFYKDCPPGDRALEARLRGNFRSGCGRNIGRVSGELRPVLICMARLNGISRLIGGDFFWMSAAGFEVIKA